MIIIIDAYNLLKQLFPKNAMTTAAQTKFLLGRLSYYKKFKEKAIKDILLVFDAGPFGHATREIRQGIVIIHAGQRSDADEWIIDFTRRTKNEEITVVSQDRELQAQCVGPHVFSLLPLEFYKIVNSIYLEGCTQVESSAGRSDSDLRKMDDNGIVAPDLEGMDADGSAMQALLEEYSQGRSPDKEDGSIRRKRRRHMPSKDERLIEKKIKKLW